MAPIKPFSTTITSTSKMLARLDEQNAHTTMPLSSAPFFSTVILPGRTVTTSSEINQFNSHFFPIHDPSTYTNIKPQPARDNEGLTPIQQATLVVIIFSAAAVVVIIVAFFGRRREKAKERKRVADRERQIKSWYGGSYQPGLRTAVREGRGTGGTPTHGRGSVTNEKTVSLGNQRGGLHGVRKGRGKTMGREVHAEEGLELPTLGKPANAIYRETDDGVTEGDGWVHR